MLLLGDVFSFARNVIMFGYSLYNIHMGIAVKALLTYFSIKPFSTFTCQVIFHITLKSEGFSYSLFV